MVVIQWAGGSSDALTHRLEELGLTVYADDPQTIEDIIRSVRDYATLGDTTRLAQVAIKRFQHRFAKPVRALGIKPRVFYQVWPQPLTTISGNHLINRVIEHCGGANAFADLPTRASTISLEALINTNPDVIIIDEDVTPDEIKTYPWAHLSLLPAVTRPNIIRIDADLLARPTFRIAEGAHQLCAKLKSAKLRTARPNGSPPPSD